MRKGTFCWESSFYPPDNKKVYWSMEEYRTSFSAKWNPLNQFPFNPGDGPFFRNTKYMCTVKKLWSLNLLFSCVISFTFNDAEDYATSETWQKIFILSWIRASIVRGSVAQWKSTKLESWRALDRSAPVLINFLKTWRVERKITFLRFLRGALRHICVMPERKLTPHRELHLWPPLYRT
jgi:hypothetical protein